MKKNELYIFLFLALAVVVSLSFTGETKPEPKQEYEYCLLLGREKAFSTKVVVSVDYGEERSFWHDARIRDEETGKVATFNSMIDALNYMNKQGWEFVNAYAITVANQNVYHWLLKRKIVPIE